MASASGMSPFGWLPHSGETALHTAAVAGRTEAAELLLGAGADPNVNAKSGVVTDLFDGGVRL